VAVRDIVRYPDPVLKQVCDAMDPCSDLGRQIALDLADTLDAGPGVGLAAPQIGQPHRVILVDAGRNPKREGQGRFVLFNPIILERSGSQVIREGCLSIPEYTGNVRRSERVVVEALNAGGEEVQIESTGYEAVVFQHEIDHLDGILFLDRIFNVKTDLFRRKPRPQDTPQRARGGED
jgi:peptide deformylase